METREKIKLENLSHDLIEMGEKLKDLANNNLHNIDFDDTVINLMDLRYDIKSVVELLHNIETYQ